MYAGDTALHVAASAHDTAVVDLFVALGADFEAEYRRGARPLHHAVDRGPGSAAWDPAAHREQAEIGRLLEAAVRR